MTLDALRAQLDIAVQKTISYLPELLVAIVIILVSIKLGTRAGRWSVRILEKLGILRASEETRLGQAFKKAGINIAELVSSLVKALIVIAGIMTALLVLNVGGQLGAYAWFAVNYAARIVGSILLLILGAFLFESLSAFLAGLFGSSLQGEKQGFVELFRDLFFVGLLAVLLSIVLNLLMLPGGLVYPLILGVTAIVIGIILSERLVDGLAKEHEEFKPVAGYAKFLLILIFIIVGVAGIFGTISQTSQIIANLAWGVAIAAAILLIPIMYALAKRLLIERAL